MPTPYDTSGLVTFSGSDRWQPDFDALLDEHFAGVLAPHGKEFEDLADLIDSHHVMNLWGCVFEDLLTRAWPPNGRNIVEDYLKRRGWREKPINKVYFRALSKSVMSLYELSDVVPGVSLMARDLIRGGAPVKVYEVSGTKALKQWDKVGARLMPRSGGYMFGGGLLLLDREAVDLLLSSLEAELPGFGKDGAAIDDVALKKCAPLFTGAWLKHAVDGALGLNDPIYQNADGEPFLLHTQRFPLSKGVTQSMVASCIDQISAMEPAGTRFWNWLALVPVPASELEMDADAGHPRAIRLTTTMEDGTPTLGTLAIKGRMLQLETNSASRARRGAALLEELLGDLVGTPSLETRTIDDIRSGHADDDDDDDGGTPYDRQELLAKQGITPEKEAEMMRELLTRQYRDVLDTPLPLFGDVSPRAAASDEATLAKVVDWLKQLENGLAKGAGRDANYDAQWMWRELEIEHLRR